MGRRRQYIGIVTSNKMQKTIVVQVRRMFKHPKYNRIIKGVVSFKAHDQEQTAHIGDTVRIEETRPLSKDKRYRLIEIMKKAESAHLAFQDETAELLGEQPQQKDAVQEEAAARQPGGKA